LLFETVALPAAYVWWPYLSHPLSDQQAPGHTVAPVTALVACFLMANVLHRTWSSGQQAKIRSPRFVTEAAMIW